MSEPVVTTWFKQPQLPTQIDRSNSLGSRIRYASTLGPNIVDVVSQTLGTNNGSTTTLTQSGIAREFVPASSRYIALPTKNIVSGYPLTVAAWLRVDPSDTAGYIAYSLNGSNYSAILGLASGFAGWAANSGSASGFVQYGTIGTGWQHVVSVHRSGTWQLYLNGLPAPGAGSNTNYGQPAAGNHSIGNRLNGSTPKYWDGLIQDLYVFEGELSAAEAASLYKNHWQVFAPLPSELWMPSTGASPDITLGLSGTYATAFAGTLSASQAVSIALAGASITASAGTLTPEQGVVLALTGEAVIASAGTLGTSQAVSIALTGTSVTASAGTLTAAQAISVALVGESVTASAGTLTPQSDSGVTLALSGASVAAIAGTLTTSQAVSIALTGSSVTASAGSLSVAGTLTLTQADIDAIVAAVFAQAVSTPIHATCDKPCLTLPQFIALK